MTAEVFEAYIAQFVTPVLRPGDIVIVDNLSAHKNSAIARLISDAGAKLRYLPPYSPDLSPIEPCWSKVKTIVRAAAARTLKTLDSAICTALRSISSSDARGWFRHCGDPVHDLQRSLLSDPIAVTSEIQTQARLVADLGLTRLP